MEKEMKDLREKVEGLGRLVVSLRKEKQVRVKQIEEEIRVCKEGTEKRLDKIEGRPDMKLGAGRRTSRKGSGKG